MEVTRKNFQEVLTELERVIPSAEFLAIDGEFTGLYTGQEINAFDTPPQYYSKIRSGSMDFLLVQFGLCLFYYDKENDKYSHRAYNFYIFPKPHSKTVPDTRFLCQTSSIEFLATEGFDFNKLFKEGIPYLTQPDEQKLRETLEEKQKSRITSINSSKSNGEKQPRIPIPNEHVSTIDDICKQIETFLDSTEPEELEFDRCNAFVRKLIFQEVALRFDSSKVYLETRETDKKNRVLVVTRVGSEEERKKKEEEQIQKELQELEDAIGFTSVLKKISESGKLILGHNMILDICHVVHQCYFPLPASYAEFKEMINYVFPNLLDTKYMSSSSLFKDTISSSVLNHLHKTLSEKPYKMYTVEPQDINCGYSSEGEKYHEAGYDAYITGLCFIAMANYIGTLQKPQRYPVLASSPLLKQYMNKLFLMRVQDSPYMNLVGEDPLLPRNHVFYIKFPKEWKISDITQLFSPFGSIFIAWINDTSAYISLHKRDQASIVKRTLTQSDRYTLMTYAAHQKLLEKRTKCRCALSGGKSLCAECIGARQTLPSSPSTSVRKRHAKESTVEEPPKRRRSNSFGEKTTYSNRSIDPIPEEQESDELEEVETSGDESEASNSSAEKSQDPKKPKVFEESNAWE